MAHGQPDYGMYTEKETVFGLADLGELAARLGSIVTFDRRGDVVWIDDFESDVLKWEATLVGVGASITPSSEAARSGGLSAKIITGNLANIATSMERFLPLPRYSGFGVEISFSLGVNISYAGLFMNLQDGVNRYIHNIMYRPQTNDLAIWAETAPGVFAWVVVAAGIDLMESLVCFHTLKMVADLSGVTYVRAILNNVEYDLSAYRRQSIALPGAPRLWIELYAAPSVNANRYVHFDDLIVTQNEV